MAPMTGKAGGHTFSAKETLTAVMLQVVMQLAQFLLQQHQYTGQQTRDAVKAQLDHLAAKLQKAALIFLTEMVMQQRTYGSGLTTNNYDGNLNLYDPVNNPEGIYYTIQQCFRIQVLLALPQIRSRLTVHCQNLL